MNFCWPIRFGLFCVNINENLKRKILPTFQHRAKISSSLKDRKISQFHRESIEYSATERKSTTISTRQKISLANKHKKLTGKTKEKISDSMKGKNLSEEHVEKLKKKTKGDGNPMYGKKHSSLTKRKISFQLGKDK